MVRGHITQLLLAAPALSLCTCLVPTTPCQSDSVMPADASGVCRILVICFMTLAGKDVCQASENQTIDLPDLEDSTTAFHWKFGGDPLNMQVFR